MMDRSLLPPLVVSVVLAAGSYLAADAARPPGAGIATVAGYAVSDVRFDHPAGDPVAVQGVRFTLAPAPPAGADVVVQMTRAGAWFACRTVGAAASCPLAGVSLAGVDQLAVSVT